MPNHTDLDATVDIPLPPYALEALAVLEADGYESWVVGGYVRDALLGRPSVDIDIATAAHWQDVQRTFEACGHRTHETGTAHGTLTVIVDEQALEITTFRSDGAYADARHPKQVSFVRTIREDLARRDFTMNALAYHPARGLFDPYGGYADLQAGVIRRGGRPEPSVLRGCAAHAARLPLRRRARLRHRPRHLRGHAGEQGAAPPHLHRARHP